jgi:hypothetical protein
MFFLGLETHLSSNAVVDHILLFAQMRKPKEGDCSGTMTYTGSSEAGMSV